MSETSYLSNTTLHAQAKWRAALLTYPGNLKEALQEAQKDSKKTLFGVAQGIPSTFLTKVYASTKPDFIWIDVEHGMFDRIVLHEYEWPYIY
jgi:4-hydroxy-2-oxoheptanedioate aldolase